MDRGCGRGELLSLDTPRVETLFGRAARVEGTLQLFEGVGERRRPKRHHLRPCLLVVVRVTGAQGAVIRGSRAGEDVEGSCGL